MKKIFFVYGLLLVNICKAQNVGVGTTAPSATAYGHGGSNRILEINNPASGANVQSHLVLSSGSTVGSFGGITWAGTSLASGEKRTGYIGNLLDGATGSKFSFLNKNASGTLVERLTLNAAGYLGIGTSTPNTPLTFPSILGRKINLYTGALGNVGMGVYANEFRIHSDYPNADITFGYENTAGTFTERMRIRGNGAITVNGNAGAQGEVLQSNGAGAPAAWTSATSQLYNNMHQFDLPASHTLGGVWNTPHFFNNLTQTINLAKTSKVLVSMNWAARSENVIGEVTATFHMNVDSDPPSPSVHSKFVRLAPGQSDRGNTGLRMLVLPPGNHTFKISVYNSGALFYYGNDYQGVPVSMNIIVIPQ